MVVLWDKENKRKDLPVMRRCLATAALVLRSMERDADNPDSLLKNVLTKLISQEGCIAS